MKRSSIVWQVALLAVIGCSGPSDTATSTPSSTDTVQQTPETSTPESVPSDGAAMTLVSLKVPNMEWGACAASVRGDLKKIAGVSDIQTDPANLTCSFKVSDPSVDYKAELAKYAKTNEHLADYSIK